MAKLSKLVQGLKPSATIILSGKVRELKAKGMDVISFTIGEPDFDTPDYIKKAAVNAMDQGFTKYTQASGIKELRDAISMKLKKDNAVNYSADEIIATSGGKHALSMLFQAVCDPGDEVIIPAPYWVSYVEQVRIAGAEPVIIQTSETTGFRITPGILSEALTPRTRLIVLNSPSNPTGMVYGARELEEIAGIALENNVRIISDEVYETIIYDGRQHVSIASLGREIEQNTFIVNSFSKTYSMPGWRVGYAAGDSEVIKAMVKLQSQTTSHPDSIAQKAAVGALEGPQDEVRLMCEAFEKRRELIVSLANDIPGFRCLNPEGAFYIFPNVSALYGKKINGREIKDSTSFAEILLDEANTAVVPGVEFGADENIRISYAASEDTIRQGMKRIGELVCRLKD